jgi:DNA repair protein RadC
MTNDIVGCKDDAVCPVCQSPYKPQRNKVLRGTKDILKCLEHFRDKKQEYFICLSLDSSRRLIIQRVVTIGTLTTALVHPREVFAGPLTDRADSHNHPSGNPAPSDADIEVTQQLVAAGQILGVTLRDHIIITRDSHHSFRKNNYL